MEKDRLSCHNICVHRKTGLLSFDLWYPHPFRKAFRPWQTGLVVKILPFGIRKPAVQVQKIVFGVESVVERRLHDGVHAHHPS